ncbi:MAG: asparagine synthetase B [Gemmatimonadales bacterium]|nr:MAG: asparagine synthetase B [Gemmatimonadales bacterium]
MSGICGLLHRDDRPVPRESIHRMLDALEAWGEGDPGTWVPESSDAPVGLGCRVMQVTPEDALERQPLVSRDKQLVLIADARIDNRAQLAAELGLGNIGDLPDSACILAAYEAWGDAAPERLLGDFAFALWDGRRRALICARDHMGQRVLFYHATPTTLAVASSIPALLTLPHVVPKLNEQKVAEFLVSIQEAGTTFYQGVRRLPPGHILVATTDTLTVHQYWSPEPRKRIVLGSDREYEEAFLEVFGAAVGARLRSSGQVGIMLSGGLDSSAVAAVAAERLRAEGRRLAAFHAAPRLGFQGKAQSGWIPDESDDVHAIAAMHENFDVTVCRPDGRTPLDQIDAHFACLGAPIRNASNLPWVEAIQEQARDRGIRVLLNGQKGNATISFSGLRTLRETAVRLRWRQLYRELRAASARGKRPVEMLKHQVVLPLVPRVLLKGYGRLRGSRPEPIWSRMCSGINPAFAEEWKLEELARERGRDAMTYMRASATEYRVQVLTATGDGPDIPHTFRARYGVEGRDPTVDVRVVEFCLAIPGSQYLREGQDRWLIRRAMASRLPERVVRRTTRGAQSADWSEWFGTMRGEIDAELTRLERSDTAQRCLDLPRLRELVNQWPSVLGPEHQGDYALTLLNAIVMGRFIRWFEERYP